MVTRSTGGTMTRRVLAVFVAALTLTACGGNVRGVPAGSPDTPAGYVTYDGLTEGFRISLPESYVAFGPDELDYEELFGEVPEGTIDGLEDQVAQIFSFGGVLMAFDLDDLNDTFMENMNILRIPSASTPVNLYMSSAKLQMEGIGAEVISAEIVDHPDGDAIRMEFRAPEFGSSGWNFTVLTDEYDWTITISTGLDEGLRAEPDTVFDSFRIAG